jgi:hypothetical protein
MIPWSRVALGFIAGAVLVAGCGGGSSSSNDSKSSSTSSSSSNSTTKASADSNTEPSSEFKAKGPNAEILKAGKEADEEEREAASEVLEESLEAREAEDWEAQCETLAAPLIKGIEEAGTTLGAGKGCPAGLEAQAAPVPPPARANTLTGPIDAFRVVGGNRGFALYHGTKGKDYVMPMAKEGGEWKVASLTEEEMR